MEELLDFRSRVRQHEDVLRRYQSVETEWTEYQLKQQRQLEERDNLKPISIVIGIAIFVLFAIINGIMKELFNTEPDELMIACLVVEVAVIGIYRTTFPMLSIRYKKADQEAQRIQEEMDQKLAVPIQEVCQAMAECFPEVPEDYRTASVVRQFAAYIDMNRVHDYESMYNLYETELHQARLEANQEAMQQELANQRQMLAWMEHNMPNW